MKWNPFPMVRIAAFFIAGILLAIYIPDALSIQLAIALAVSLLIIYFSLYLVVKKKTGAWPGSIALLSVFLFGYCRLYFSTQSHVPDHLLSIKEKLTAYRAIVRSVPEEKSKSWKVEVELVDTKTDDWKTTKGKILLYVAKTSSKPNWSYGDLLLINGSPREINPPGNPGEFDFKRFLGFKNIYHQHFVQPTYIRLLDRAEGKGFIYYSHQARAWSMRKLNRFVQGEQQQVIAAALVLGVTDGIDNDLQNAYAASGAMHVLAVSGLHVGIIYAIILFLLKPLGKYSWSRWLVAAISLFSLWAFAFVTGLSPSVLRAVTMFSFIAVARPLGWRTNIYNTLAGSAFVLLIYNPYLVMSVGFQLSYLAVLGIVYLQRPIYNLWSIDNKAGDWIWQITCVSIAAQVATFSLGLLYFHQFPVYFIVSNLFVIPLSTGVLVIGIFLLAISFIAPLAGMIGFVLEWIIKALNWIVFRTEDLPFSLINNIYLTTFQCWLLMGIILSIILLFEYRNIKWLYAGFGFTVLFAIGQWIHFYVDVKKNEFVVYNINGHQAIEFISNGNSVFVSDSLLKSDNERIRFHIQPNRLRHGIATITSVDTNSFDTLGVNYFWWRKKLIGFVTDKEFKLPQNIELDYLVVSNNSMPINQMKSTSGKQIILDGSNSIKYADRFLKDNDMAYSTLLQGAFLIED